MTKNVTPREITTDAGFGPKVERSKFDYYINQFPVFVKKNKGLLSKPDFWKILPRLAAGRFHAPAIAKDGPVLFVATHHKAMTTYFNAVLRLFAIGTRLPFEKINLEQPDPRSRVFLSNHSKMDLSSIGPYRGIHIMRDPRDMIISSYHYHKWTYEAWAHRPDANGVSYQQKLKAATKTDGLFMEINHFIFFYRKLLENWNLDDPDVLEVKYEDLMGPDRDTYYRAIFDHFGLDQRAHRLGVDLMKLFEAASRTGTDNQKGGKFAHIRSGASQQWKSELEPQHIEYIDHELGHVLRRFGYDTV